MFDSDIIDIFENKTAKFIRDGNCLPLSDECSSINYYIRAGGLQDLTMVSKFLCNKAKADEELQKLIAWNDGVVGKKGDRYDLTSPPFEFDKAPKKEMSKIQWWDIKSAKIVKASISNEGFGLSYWISEPINDTVTVYLYQSP